MNLLIKGINPKILTIVVLNSLRMIALSTKHKGFQEEKEWRLIYNPKIQESRYMKCEVEIINDVPQTVAKIPFADKVDETYIGSNLNDLIERVIVGPTNNTLVITTALVSSMKNAGIENADGKIFISDIPLRN